MIANDVFLSGSILYESSLCLYAGLLILKQVDSLNIYMKTTGPKRSIRSPKTTNKKDMVSMFFFRVLHVGEKETMLWGVGLVERFVTHF